jgi:hypothetical protein
MQALHLAHDERRRGTAAAAWPAMVDRRVCMVATEAAGHGEVRGLEPGALAERATNGRRDV